MSKLKDKVALITGGSSGIGLATARLFAAEGAFVIVTGRRQAELTAAVSLLGDTAIGIQGDAIRSTDLDRLFARIRDKHGRIDVLFANAGAGEFLPLGAITEKHFDATFAVNVKGTLFTVQKALPLMPDGSCVVLNASIASVKGMPAFSVYSATKAAVRSFARGWAVDLRARKIRVNAVSPGTIPTPGYDQLGLTAEQIEGFPKSKRLFHWAGWARRRRLQRRCSSSHPMTAATSTAWNSSWMAVSLRSSVNLSLPTAWLPKSLGFNSFLDPAKFNDMREVVAF